MGTVLATYRLQFRAEFSLADAAAITPYLERLGISHIHSSPLLRARPGSGHGYDVADPTRLNPELGTDADFTAFVDGLHQRGLGLLLDIVPNHMAAARENTAWEDVLRHGPASPCARWFDIDWRNPDPAEWHRIMVPVLGDLRVRVLQRDELALALEPSGEFRITYFEHSYPVDPATLGPVYRWIAAAADRAGLGDSAMRVLDDAAAELRMLPRRTTRAEADLSRRRDQSEAVAAAVARLWHDGAAFAVAAEAAAGFARGEEGRRRLRRLLDAQAYRLVHWRRAAREINYRRFFDVNDLIALHMEDPEVFRATHERILGWIRDGAVDGVRVDHIDGLLDPAGYLERLRDAAFPGGHPGHVPIYIEKILAPAERLRPGWLTAGTTGYDFLNQAEDLFLDPAGCRGLEAEYHRVTRRPLEFDAVARLSKRRALERGLSAGLGAAAARLHRVVADAGIAPPTRHAMVRALMEFIVYLPVYRTYLNERAPVAAGEDRRLIERSLADTRMHGRADRAALDLLEQALLADDGPLRAAGTDQARLRAAERIQQLSGPAAAKGIEDTAFYRFYPLLSRNEVGADPALPPDAAVERFHQRSAERAAEWPRAMLTVTTHDTKRNADVRARLDVLSEVPALWARHLQRWRRWNAPFKRAAGERRIPDVNTIYLLHQTAVGIWPLEAVRSGRARLPERAMLSELTERMVAYGLKAAREAKQETSWTDPDKRFEAALRQYTESMLDPDRAPRFLEDLGRFVATIARPGMWNALARTLLQLTAPGVPDLYQGDELWNFALVDPDNRRPVDFERRWVLLDGLIEREAGPPLFGDLMAEAEDGRIKLYLIWRALQFRRDRPALFLEGSYRPLRVRGSAASHVLAFGRELGGEVAIAIAPRLTMTLLPEPAADPLGPAIWGDTEIELPPEWSGGSWECVLSAGQLPGGATLRVADALASLPVALLAAV